MSAINIYRKEKDKFVFDLKEFSRIVGNGPGTLIAIYSMVGQKEARNDILLNCLCNYLTKFDPLTSEDQSLMWTTSKEETDEQMAGIWMFGKPFFKTMADGTKVTIFLLNSQLSSETSTSLYDNSLVLTMTTLLSSVLVFNQMSRLSVDILDFFRHSTVFARYELNDDQPFQKLIFFVQDCTDIEEENPDQSLGFHSEDNLSHNELPLYYDYLSSQKQHSKREMSVRQSINSTFKESYVCLSQKRLEPGSPLELSYLWELIRNICVSKFICIKTIGEECATGPHLIRKVKKWSKTLEEYTIPSKMSAKLLSDAFYNQMALNSAIDYYYYEMKHFMTENNGLNLEEIQIKLNDESIEIFKCYPLSGGKAFEKRTIRSFWENLNENHNYFNQTKDENKILWNQSMSLFEFIQKFQSFDELLEKFDNLKAESDAMKNDFDTKLEDVMKEVADIKLFLDDYKTLILRKKVENENVEDGINGFVGDKILTPQLFLYIAKLIYKNL